MGTVRVSGEEDAMREAKLERIEPERPYGWKMFRRAEPFTFEWHFHPEYELVVIEHGHGTRFVGDSVVEFTAGDLVLLGPNLPHTYVSDSFASALTSQFDDGLLGTGWTRRPEFADVERLLRRSASGLLFPGASPDPWRAMLRMAPARRTAELLIRLVELAERDDATTLASPGYEPRIDRRAMTRIGAVMGYIDDHLDEPITVEDLAEVACLSRDATGRFFRRQTGRTIPEYINQARIAAACRLLIDTDQSVSDVAFGCGYANLANFHRQFRRVTGTTPSAFRDRHLLLAG